MRRIEVPSEDLAVDLQKHLQERRFPSATYDKGRRALQYQDSLNPSEWSNIRTAAEKWAKGRNLEVSESIRFYFNRPEPTQQKPEPTVDKAELKKRLDTLSPEKAEERYKYLSSKPFSELTEAEYQERLELAQRELGKPKGSK